MMDNDKFIGCFVSGPTVHCGDGQQIKNIASERGKLFRSYIWGEKGISILLKKIKHENYGKDLLIILFQYYVNPLLIELQSLKEIEPYRKNEKSIGIPIIVNDKNFFDKSEEERCAFLKQSIFEKLNLLGCVVKKKKLDTNIGLLKRDLEKLLDGY